MHNVFVVVVHVIGALLAIGGLLGIAIVRMAFADPTPQMFATPACFFGFGFILCMLAPFLKRRK